MSTSQKKSRTFWLRLHALAPTSKPRPRENSSFSWIKVKLLNRVSLKKRRKTEGHVMGGSVFPYTGLLELPRPLLERLLQLGYLLRQAIDVIKAKYPSLLADPPDHSRDGWLLGAVGLQASR
ncbi:hypothetical protein EYF80_030643 [Liparis tanakae]|uniref:Uncharacterized protein n=1 Tax=Liparis tanakae TaxID=230148 RepID=A0A4Z2H032_9TELE|nr:hypothetical protein EYF80_030643 [Liparis tanakae]